MSLVDIAPPSIQVPSENGEPHKAAGSPGGEARHAFPATLLSIGQTVGYRKMGKGDIKKAGAPQNAIKRRRAYRGR